MPLTAVLIVLLSIALMFLYGVPTLRSRLSDSTGTLVFTQAAATAEAVSQSQGDSDLGNRLRLVTDSTGGEVVLVSADGGILAQRGLCGRF
jgi:hypothetical protein